MTALYHSGLRDPAGRPWQPPLGVGGHAYLEIVASDTEYHWHKRARAVRARWGTHPGVWRCARCYHICSTPNLREGRYPRPCMGGVAALAPGTTKA